MAKVEGVTDLGIFPVLGQPNLNIKVDREKAARCGLNAGALIMSCRRRSAAPWQRRCWRPTVNSTSPCGSSRNIAT